MTFDTIRPQLKNKGKVFGRLSLTHSPSLLTLLSNICFSFPCLQLVQANDMCFGSHPVLGIVPALFSLSQLLTETPFSLFFSLRESALQTSKYAKQLLLLELPSSRLHPASPFPTTTGQTYPQKCRETAQARDLSQSGNSGKSNILAHQSLAKNTKSTAILRDDGMGKLCLESWIQQSRQGFQQTWEEELNSSTEGKRASNLADART